MLVIDVPFLDIQSLKLHPFVANNYGAIIDDFNSAHAEFMCKEVLNVNAIPDLSRFKTDLLSSFIAGMLWLFKPDGKCNSILMPKEKTEEQSSLILP